MRNGWPEVRLGDHVELTAGFAFKSRQFTNNHDDVPLVKGSTVQQGYIDWDTAPRWPAAEVDEYKRFELVPGDVVLAMDRPWVEAGLKYGWIKPGDPRSLLVQRVARLRGTKGLRTEFVRYIIGSPQFTAYIRPIVTGVNVPHISGDQIRGYRFRLPPQDAQDQIVTVLAAYDDLIENNTRRIAILEEMAQAIYREWFVDFRFPGHEQVERVESELGPIPTGWEVRQLGELAEEVRRSVDPAQLDPDTPCVGLEHLPRRSIALAEWGRAADVKSTKLYFRKGEILFGKIRPYFHKVGVPPLDGICSSDTIVIVPKAADYSGLVLACVSSDDFVAHATQTSQGTKMPRANWNVLVEYPVVTPPSELLRRFSEIINDVVGQIHNLIFRNRNLREARDLLLPRLISGEIDVVALEDELAGAA